MDVIRRIGTQKKKFKVQFFIGRLKFSTLYPGKIYIVIRRGNHKIKSEQKLEMGEDCKINFKKEILELQVTLFFDQKQNKYHQKLGQMSIVLLDSKQSKSLLGVVPFDVAKYANSGKQSIKEKKVIQQTPKKLQGLIQYNIFVKYIGEGSESSLDKISDFFFGKAKQPEFERKISNNEDFNTKKQQDNQPQSRNKKARYSNHSEQKQKDLSRTQYKNRKFDEPLRGSKNYNTTGKQRNEMQLTNVSNLQGSRNFYFDQPVKKINRQKQQNGWISVQRINVRNQRNDKRGNKERLESQEEDQGQSRARMNQSQWKQKDISGRSKEFKDNNTRQSDRQIERQRTVDANHKNPIKISQLQRQLEIQIQQAQSYRFRFQQSQALVETLQDQLSHNKSQNNCLIQQIKNYKQKLQLKEEQLLQKQRGTYTKTQNISDPQLKEKLEYYQQELKKMEREKNELIVENSKLKDKHKQDFKRYEQILSEKEQKHTDLSQSGKLQLLKMKQECSNYRESIQKLTRQKKEKVAELNTVKNESKPLQQQLTQLKTALSKIKLKIGNHLNEASLRNQETIINMLMEINKQ